MFMKITVAQLNPTVGDILGNLKAAARVVHRAAREKSDLVVFPELFLVGYPPKDLLEVPGFIRQVEKAVDELASLSANMGETGFIMGAPARRQKNKGKGLYNSALFFFRGRVRICQSKSLLPTYDVFDEARYFDPAEQIDTLSFKEESIGVSICEDAWNDSSQWPEGRIYSFDPTQALANSGATLFINISASPFSIGKEQIRYTIMSGHAKKHSVPFLYVNQVGGNDELLFDGKSLYINENGKPAAVFESFGEQVKTIDTDARAEVPYSPQERISSAHDALVMGIRDYMRKCGFERAVVGLSGGIDSAVTVSLAVRAIGEKNVLGLALPSPFSSKGSVEDSKTLAKNLGIKLEVIPISDIYRSYLDTLTRFFSGTEQDVTEENIQARIRGNILMAFSNKFGYLLLTTGNKSELAVGYCTLYGDMSGGLAVLSDVPKTMVYALADLINRSGAVIPRSIIEKAPSAELRPDQKDADSLPPYAVLDKVLAHHIEERMSADDLISMGYDPETVRWVVRTVAQNEYKRTQAPVGLRVTTKAFGVGRRMPIAAKFPW
jgi:NAD+ synthase (glutamine-hydrolysing)